MTKIKTLIALFFCLFATSFSQNTWTVSGNDILNLNSGNVGIGTSSPQFKLDVFGDVRINNNLFVGGGIISSQTVNATGMVSSNFLHVTGPADFSDINLSNDLKFGAPIDQLQIKHIQGNSTTPSILKFTPSWTGPAPGGGVEPPDGDPVPNLACVNGTQMPTIVNAFSQMLSVAFNNNPNTSTGTGGNILMGHNGQNAFIETQGTGTAPNNHPGDLLINNMCSRNVFFFNHGVAFANGSTNVVSIAGKLNVKEHLQVGATTGSNFFDNTSKLFVLADIGANKNGLKIKHGAASFAGLQVATYGGTSAFIVNNGTTSTADGPISFKIEGDGSTGIRTATPYKSLTVNGDVSLANYGTNPANGLNALEILGNNQTPTRRGISLDSDPNGNFNFFINTNQTSAGFNFKNGVNGNTLLSLNSDGKLSLKIQSASTATAFEISDFSNTVTFKVRPNGTAYCQEMFVMLTPFPDYVFNESYSLMKLEDLKSYIKINKHLPNVPSATEVENNGAGLGQLGKIQMEKIEEIYLHLIDLNEQIKALKEENETLKKKIK